MFYTVYNVTIEQSDPNLPPKKVMSPIASIHEDKFRITYENGDYEELDHNAAFRKAKAWFRVNLGCKFEGDLNPATGNRIRDVYSDCPCNCIMVIERKPLESYGTNQ